FMHSSIRDDASMYVGTQAAMATHSAAMSRRRHVRWALDVGARSGLQYGEAAISPRGSTSSCRDPRLRRLPRARRHGTTALDVRLSRECRGVMAVLHWAPTGGKLRGVARSSHRAELCEC